MYLLGAATSYIILPPPRKYQFVAALVGRIFLGWGPGGDEKDFFYQGGANGGEI